MKFLVTIFNEDDLPKKDHMGIIMVDYNNLFDMENRGYTPTHKLIEVPHDIWDGITYAPIERDSKEAIKYTTHNSIRNSYKNAYMTKEEYEHLLRILDGETVETSDDVKDLSMEEIIEKLSGVKSTPGQNSMGASESWYNPYFMVKVFLEDKNVNPGDLELEELIRLIQLASFASEIFY